MTRDLPPQDNFDSFVEKYSQSRSRASRQVEREALGHEVGLNGYTTTKQAQALCNRLQLQSTGRLLDVGAGRGWPGTHVADSSGCRLVSTDVPLDALRDVKRRVYGSRVRRAVVAADGRALPFTSNCFHAIVHADVFC